MTAADRLCVMYHLSHVFGPWCADTDILPAGMLAPLLEAIAHAQLILLATTGRRQYTSQDLKLILDRGYVVVFASLEQVTLIYCC